MKLRTKKVIRFLGKKTNPLKRILDPPLNAGYSWQSREWVDGSWVMGQMGHENRMGHMGHGSLGVDP